MKALILNNKVVDVQVTEFPVHNSMTWVDCGDEVKIGFTHSGGVFTAPIVVEKTYDEVRKKAFPRLGDVIDAIFKKEAGDSTEFDNLATQRQTVKNANPKP
jgi:hypothetical protein